METATSAVSASTWERCPREEKKGLTSTTIEKLKNLP